MLLGCFTLPESTRWLLSKGRNDEAWKSLAWMRGDEGDRTQEEFTETQLGLRAEEAVKEAFSIKELLEPANRLRFFIGPMLFVFQNATGSSALAVFAPQYFKLLVGSSGTRDLLLTGLFGAVKVIACTFFIWVLSERFGRKTLLTSGSALMAICMLITALIVDEIPTESGATVTSAGRATVAMIYLDIMVSLQRQVLLRFPMVLAHASDSNIHRSTTAHGARCRGPTPLRFSPREFVPSAWQQQCWLIGLLLSAFPLQALI